MTVKEIAEEHDVSRVSIHTYRRRGVFPQPVEGEGTTRLRFRADEVAAFFAANPKQPGKRTDRTPKPEQQGAPMDARKDLYAFAMQGKEHSPAVSEKASAKINAFRADVIRKAADAVAQLIDEGEHDPDCLVDELRSMARETPQAEEE